MPILTITLARDSSPTQILPPTCRSLVIDNEFSGQVLLLRHTELKEIKLGNNVQVNFYALCGSDNINQKIIINQDSRLVYECLILDGDSGEHFVSFDICHNSSGSYSRLKVRRLIAGKAHNILQGKLTITAKATGCDSYLADKVLLLGKNARAESEPALEILTDSVRASHGAAIGHLDESELFYLQARGLNRFEATQLLTTAFARVSYNKAPPEFKQQCEQALTNLVSLYA